MTASFLFFAIVIGVLAGMKEGTFTDSFVTAPATCLAWRSSSGSRAGSRSIMNNGQITDTVLYWAEQAVAGLGGVAFINLMFGLFVPLSIPHPLVIRPGDRGDAHHGAAGESRERAPELVVTAYQSGNGLVNLVNPTFAVVMGGLAIARVGYGTWLRFVWPVLVLLAILVIAVLSISVLL